MSSDYRIIKDHPQHFGNEKHTFDDIVPASDFPGQNGEFSFPCPNVNADEPAVLMFQSRDVDNRTNVIRINNADVIGGLPVSPNRDTWNGNVMIIPPQHRLKPTGNTLHVESRNASGGTSGDIDDFILDNIVIMYKTRTTSSTNQV